MLGLPKSTEVNKPLPKKAIFDKFLPSTADRRLFDEQISRLAIVAEISPSTVNVATGEDVAAIYVINVLLKTDQWDRKNIALLSKLIDQRMLFVLQYDDQVWLAVCRAGKVLVSESRLLDDWHLGIRGLDLGAVWEHYIAQIGNLDLSDGNELDEAIVRQDRREKLIKRIVALEKKAQCERQARRKWEYVEEIRKLKQELEDDL